MERLVKGDVVVLPFPFSDLTSTKRRPALVLTNLKGADIILCQITSEARHDDHSIRLEFYDFAKGKLNVASMIRPNKLFTADISLIKYKIGALKQNKITAVIEKLINILKS